MRTYWFGEGKMVRVPIVPASSAKAGTPEELAHTLAASLGFTTLLDRTTTADEGEGVLVFGPHDPTRVPTPPGRDDLDADSLVVWMRASEVTGLFFSKTFADVVAILSMIATFTQALGDITAQGEHALLDRGQRAPQVTSLTNDLPRQS